MSGKRKRDEPFTDAGSRKRTRGSGFKSSKARIPGKRSKGYKQWAVKVRSYKRPWVEGLGGYYIGGYARGNATIPGIGKVNAGIAGGYYKGGDRAMDRLAGLGAYSHKRIRRNTLLRPDPPMIANSFRGDENSTVIRHREFIKNITSSDVAGGFKIETFPINPAQPAAFPWLSTVAANFEEYSFEGLCFEFQSTSSDAIASSTNLALGSVMMVTQYDVENPPFTNAQSLLNYDWAQSSKVSQTALHFVECDPRQIVMPRLFTRNPSESTDDLRFTDHGNFSIATEGLQGTSVMIGRLWVSYQIRLSKPKLSQTPAVTGSYYFARNYSGGVSNLNPFGDVAQVDVLPENNLPITIADVGNNGRITFPLLARPATYKIEYQLEHDAINTGAGVSLINLTNGVSLLNMWDDLTQNTFELPLSTASQTKYFATWYVNVPAGNSPGTADIAIDYNPLNVSMDLHVISVPYLDPNVY